MFDVGYNFFLENTFQHNFIRLLSTANIHYYSLNIAAIAALNIAAIEF